MPRNSDELNIPPRNPLPIDTADAAALAKNQPDQHRQFEAGRTARYRVQYAAVAAAEDLRKGQRSEPEQQTAQRRTRAVHQRDAAHCLLDPGDSDHDPDREQAGENADRSEDQIMADDDVGLRENDKDRPLVEQGSRDQGRHDRCGDDRDQRRQRVAADDQLERIKGAGERGIKGGGNRRGGAASHKNPQIVAAQLE